MKIAMKKTLMLLAMTFLTQLAQAEWEAIAVSNSKATVYIEPKSIKKVGDDVKVWILIDLPVKHKNGALSQKEYREYKCSTLQMKRLQVSYYPKIKGAGLRIDAVVKADDATYIEPDSIDQMIFNKLCSSD